MSDETINTNSNLSLDFANEDFSNFVNLSPKKSIDAIPVHLFDYTDLSVNNLLRRMVSVTISNLSYRECFENLYSDDLIGLLAKMMRNGSLKCTLLVFREKQNESEEDIYIAHRILTNDKEIQEFKKKKEYKSYEFIDIDIRVNTDLSKMLYNYLYTLNTLSNVTVNSIMMSRSLTLKIADFRKNVPSSYLEQVESKVARAIGDTANGTAQTIILDAGDSLTQSIGDTSSYEQNMQNTIFGRLSLLTSFPMSFFSGIFNNSIGSTNAGEREMIYNAKLSLYHSYLAPFFKRINNAIDIKIDLNTGSIDPNVIAIAEMHSDIVDLEEVLRMYNFPMKKDKKIGEVVEDESDIADKKVT
jgi:hypothetical protein